MKRKQKKQMKTVSCEHGSHKHMHSPPQNPFVPLHKIRLELKPARGLPAQHGSKWCPALHEMPLRVMKLWGVTRPKMSCFEPWVLDAAGLQVVPHGATKLPKSLCQLPSCQQAAGLPWWQDIQAPVLFAPNMVLKRARSSASHLSLESPGA